MTTTEPHDLTDEQRQQIATMREEMAGVAGILPPETLTELSELIDDLEAGKVSEEEAQEKAQAIYSDLMGGALALATGAGIDPAALGLGGPSLPAELPTIPTDAPAGVAGADLAEALSRAELSGLCVILTPAQAGELADVANFGVWYRDEAMPLLEGLRPLVERIAEVGPAIKDATPLQLVQLVIGGFGKGG